MSVKLVIIDIYILTYSSDVKPTYKRFMKVILGDLKPPILKFLLRNAQI